MKVKLDQLEPKLRARIEAQMAKEDMLTPCQTNYALQRPQALNAAACHSDAVTAGDKVAKPLSNKTERRFRAILEAREYNPIWEQAITLRLDAPFTSYRPDYATFKGGYLWFYEVKAPHRFARAGIAKAALAAKTYPQFKFILAMWEDGQFKETVL